MRQHLLECVERIVKEGNKEFFAEAVVARKRRGGKEVGVAGKQAQTIKKKIKSEPQADSEAVVDRDNNETSKKPTETSNEQESKRTKVKNELTVVSVESVNVDDESDESRKPSTSTSGVNNGDSGDGLSRAAVDEDHCYAVAHGRVKAEYWPEYDNNAATAFTSIQVRPCCWKSYQICPFKFQFGAFPFFNTGLFRSIPNCSFLFTITFCFLGK